MSHNPIAHNPDPAKSEPTAAIVRTFASLDKLETLCCDPERSPQMQSLRSILEEVRDGVEAPFESTDTVELLRQMEEAGSQLGKLQVTCCAPKRNPLYSGILQDLNTIQVDLSRRAGVGH